MAEPRELGDEGVLEELSEQLRKRIERDPLLIPMFENVDMNVLSRKHHLFFTMLFLGNTEIGAEKLHAAHQNLNPQGGIKDVHFDAFVGHIMDACRDLNIAPDCTSRVMKALETVRPSIVS